MSAAEQRDFLAELAKAPEERHRLPIAPRVQLVRHSEPLAPPRSDREQAITWLKELVFPDLIARALERVDRDEAPGITADDAVALCKARPQSALLGSAQRAFSWVGPWLAKLDRAGLLAEFRLTGQPVRRRSARPGAHGNLQIVYLHPMDRRAQQGAR